MRAHEHLPSQSWPCQFASISLWYLVPIDHLHIFDDNIVNSKEQRPSVSKTGKDCLASLPYSNHKSLRSIFASHALMGIHPFVKSRLQGRINHVIRCRMVYSQCRCKCSGQIVFGVTVIYVLIVKCNRGEFCPYTKATDKYNN